MPGKEGEIFDLRKVHTVRRRILRKIPEPGGCDVPFLLHKIPVVRFLKTQVLTATYLNIRNAVCLPSIVDNIIVAGLILTT